MARPKNPNNTLHKICPTCQNPFICERRKEKTYCCKKCATNNPITKEKNRQGVLKSFEQKYGGHPMTINKETKQKLAESMIKKFGVAHFSQTEEFLEKVKKTKLERYGNENYNNPDERKETCLKKYGVENYTQTLEYKESYKKTCLIRYGTPHASLSERYKDSHKKLMFEKFLKSNRFANFSPQFTIDQYQGVTIKFNKKYSFKCNRCSEVHDYDISNGKYLKCPKCDKKTSEFQLEVQEFIQSLLGNVPILINDRTTLYPAELDIFIPSLKLAIETNGLYYHTEISGGKNKMYHLNKTKLCASKGIRLIHIFDNEWNDKREIVKSILMSSLVKTNKIIYARECKVMHVSPDKKTKFLLENHIQGNDHSTIKLGLYKDDELLSIMTFIKSRFDKKLEWEMSRFCTKIGYTVTGGGSKLFFHFIKENSPRNVVSYSDRRYFSGNFYLKLGFQFIDNTSPNYYYIIDTYDKTESRINWQKAKLSKKLVLFDPNLSEWENMKTNGFDRIWDCGHSKWVWREKI